MNRLNDFDHEKLDVYKVSIEFVILSNEIAEQLPQGKSYLADQLQRASSSIALNIAYWPPSRSAKRTSRALKGSTSCWPGTSIA